MSSSISGTESRENTHCCVPMVGAWQSYSGLFLRNCFQGPSSNMVLLLASFFSILILPYWFQRLINVKHQKLVSLIMVRKGCKNSGVWASGQRLYQLVPVTASWKKKTLLLKNLYTWFQKDTYHACTHLIYKGFLPRTRTYLLLKIPPHLRGVWHRRDKYEKLNLKLNYLFRNSILIPLVILHGHLINMASVSFQCLCLNSKHVPDVLPVTQRQE